jgi:glycosyltransferase involved in cell wall biosynthesis
MVGHSCVLSWSDACGPIDGDRLERYRVAVTAGLDAADEVIAPTSAMRAALRRHYGELPRARVVPNGRDAARFPAAEKRPLVLTAGRLWDRAKNVAAVARVAPQLSWPVVAAGDGPVMAGVRCLGRLSEIALRGWLQRAAIFALPARYEPFGLLPLEAALSGCALVLGDVDSLHEVWDNAAVFVNPDDPDALCAAIERLIASPDRRRKYAARARARARIFTPERMARGYLEVYDRARQRHNSRGVPCAS